MPIEYPGHADAAQRALAAGAIPPLRHMGTGGYGVVFCDSAGRAWKLARFTEPPDAHALTWAEEALGSEYEWLRDAGRTSIAPFVAQVYAYHPAALAIERECIFGSPGGWGQGRELSELHRAINAAMVAEAGWTAPEFKEDSYIYRESDGRPILVDASLALRIGMNLARWILEVLDGQRRTTDTPHSLAFYILREGDMGAVPREIVATILRRLLPLDPTIRNMDLKKYPGVA